jgi:uncharacterized membrane protein
MEAGINVIDIGEPNAQSTGISGNGEVFVGTCGKDIYDPYVKAFRWSESEGVAFLGSLHPRGGNYPTAISHDGSVVVGTARGEQGFRAYRWRNEQGTIPPELPQGFVASAADDVSANGQIVVGRLMVVDYLGLGGTLGWPPNTVEQSQAMIWDPANGTRILKDVLINEYGLADDLAGWSLVSASAISANGTVIAGVGVNPAGYFQGWVVIIPEPHTLFLSLGLLAFLLLARCSRL